MPRISFFPGACYRACPANEKFGHLFPNVPYRVLLEGQQIDDDIEDPLADYERGRRRLEPRGPLPDFPLYEG